MIDLNGSFGQIVKANTILSHIENGAPKAINNALNRTIDGVRTDVARKITKMYDIKMTDVRAGMKVRKSTMATLRASVNGAGSPIPLIKFRVTPNKPGYQAPGTVLRASVKRSGGKPIPDAFVAKMSNGHIGVFERSGKASKPIEQLYGPAIPQMMNEANIQKEVMTGAESRFEKRLDHEIAYLLGKE